MTFLLTQANGNVIDLANNTQVQVHAQDKNNYFEIIINQINQCLYKDYLPDINKPATIIDIGTNIGMFSLHVAIPGWKIHSFEPTHHFCEIFNSILEQNKIESVKLNECAVFNYDGETDFGYCGFNSTMNSIGANYNAGTTKVQCIRLSSYMAAAKLESVDFVKLDAEGAEPAILDSMPIEFMNKVKCWFIEFHGDKGGNRAKYKTLMEGFGYVTTEQHDDTLICQRPKVEELKTIGAVSNVTMPEIDSSKLIPSELSKEMVANYVDNDFSVKTTTRQILLLALHQAAEFADELTGTEKKTLPYDTAKQMALERIADKYIERLVPTASPIKSITLHYESGEPQTLNL